MDNKALMRRARSTIVTMARDSKRLEEIKFETGQEAWAHILRYQAQLSTAVATYLGDTLVS